MTSLALTETVMLFAQASLQVTLGGKLVPITMGHSYGDGVTPVWRTRIGAYKEKNGTYEWLLQNGSWGHDANAIICGGEVWYNIQLGPQLFHTAQSHRLVTVAEANLWRTQVRVSCASSTTYAETLPRWHIAVPSAEHTVLQTKPITLHGTHRTTVSMAASCRPGILADTAAVQSASHLSEETLMRWMQVAEHDAPSWLARDPSVAVYKPNIIDKALGKATDKITKALVQRWPKLNNIAAAKLPPPAVKQHWIHTYYKLAYAGKECDRIGISEMEFQRLHPQIPDALIMPTTELIDVFTPSTFWSYISAQDLTYMQGLPTSDSYRVTGGFAPEFK